jgi:hypothetical protein
MFSFLFLFTFPIDRPHSRLIEHIEPRLTSAFDLLLSLFVSRLGHRFSVPFSQFLNMASVFMKIFNLICMMLLIGHWSGCLQFLVPMLQGFPPNSWVAINDLKVRLAQIYIFYYFFEANTLPTFFA